MAWAGRIVFVPFLDDGSGSSGWRPHGEGTTLNRASNIHHRAPAAAVSASISETTAE
jgi:hypothetical protein